MGLKGKKNTQSNAFYLVENRSLLHHLQWHLWRTGFESGMLWIVSSMSFDGLDSPLTVVGVKKQIHDWHGELLQAVAKKRAQEFRDQWCSRVKTKGKFTLQLLYGKTKTGLRFLTIFTPKCNANSSFCKREMKIHQKV